MLALLLVAICSFASHASAQTVAFPDPRTPGATTPSFTPNQGSGAIPTTNTCTTTALVSDTDFIEGTPTVLTIVQGSPVAERTFTLAETIRANILVYPINYQVDALGVGNNLKVGQDAARDYMGLTLRVIPGSLSGTDNAGSLIATLGGTENTVFRNGFGVRTSDSTGEQREYLLVSGIPTNERLEVVFTPAADTLTEGRDSRIQIAYDQGTSGPNSCTTAGQVFELHVVPALSDVTVVAAFNDATDTPLNHYIATDDSMLFFKLALPNDPDPYEVAYEMASAEVIVGTNIGTTLVVSVPDTPAPDEVVEVELLATLDAGDIIAIDAVAIVRAEATHTRLSGHFLVTVVDSTISNTLSDTDNSPDEIVVVAPHRVMPGVYALAALAAGETQSAHISNPATVIPGESTPTDHIAEAGVFNFTVTDLGLTEASSRADVVITLETTLTTTAIPHKYAMATDTTTATWNVFDTSEGDTWYGAVMTDDDACPAVNSDAWKPEVLEAGDQCLRVTLTDGGMNDADGVRNGVIHDPIALVALGGGSGASKGGGGAMHWLLLLAALLPLAMSFGARGRPFKNSGRGLPVNR